MHLLFSENALLLQYLYLRRGDSKILRKNDQFSWNFKYFAIAKSSNKWYKECRDVVLIFCEQKLIIHSKLTVVAFDDCFLRDNMFIFGWCHMYNN